jgi:hypothetical protein
LFIAHQYHQSNHHNHVPFYCVAQLARLVPLILLAVWFITGLAIVLLFRTNPKLKNILYNLDVWFTIPQPPTTAAAAPAPASS